MQSAHNIDKAANNGHLHRILVVEDEPNMIQYYSDVLGNDYDLLTASSGDSAIKKLTYLDNVDLIIIDYRLPDISGIDVLKEIKRLKPEVPVIMITAFGDEEVAVNSFRQGVRDYIKKPISYDELTNTIAFYLSPNSGEKKERGGVLIYKHHSTLNSHLVKTSGKNYYNIQKALKYINDNYTSKISLSVAADKACMSKYHFSREFRKSTNISFRDYLRIRRIEKAKEMLLYDTHTITEIAFSVGFADATHFERIFKKTSGLTPSKYKNANKARKSV